MSRTSAGWDDLRGPASPLIHPHIPLSEHDGDLVLGHLVVLDSALRDVGTSFQHLPRRTIDFTAVPRATLEGVLDARGVPYVVGRTWTTDAPYRETPGKIGRRRDEGCLVAAAAAPALRDDDRSGQG